MRPAEGQELPAKACRFDCDVGSSSCDPLESGVRSDFQTPFPTTFTVMTGRTDIQFAPAVTNETTYELQYYYKG
jgi:hypothetical protein